MAAAALRKRDFAASKLRDSVRQMRRYLDGFAHTERIIVQKCDKVDIDREALIARHHEHSERSMINLDEEEMREYIEPKIDEAVDIVDEATIMIETLSSDAKRTTDAIIKETVVRRDQLELASFRLQAESYEKLMLETLTEMDAVLRTDEPTHDDVSKCEMYLIEIQNREEGLIKSWNDVKIRVSNEEEILQIVTREENVSGQITQRRVRGKLFATKNRVDENSDLGSLNEARIGGNSNVKLQRMKPPKFSGDIRDFARFKADFDKIVKTSYTDPVHQVYVMKETCLQGEAYDLVRNLEELADIWERLTEKYGDTIEIVDSVIKDLQNINIPRFNQDQGVINLIETLEKGIQDLTAIGKRSEIANAYTVKLIECKLPRRVMIKWLEEEEKHEGDDSRFEKLLMFLKKERKRTEKIVQQFKEKGKEKDKDREKDREKEKRHPVHFNNKGNKPRNNNNCLIHQSASHLTRKCQDFLAKTVEERGQLVKDLAACKLCLSLSHVGNSCPWEEKWNPCGVDKCSELHSRLIHGSKALNMHIFQASVKRDENEEDTRTLLLMQDIPSTGCEIFTFWDNGSTISLVSKCYARKKNLKGIKVTYDLVTVGNVVRPQNTVLYDVPIVDRDGNTLIIKAYEIDEICQEVAVISNEVAKLFKGLKVKDVKRPQKKVELLIGMNYIRLHPKLLDNNQDLALFSSSFGTGKIIGGTHKSIKGTDELNAFAKIVAYNTPRDVRVDRSKCIDFLSLENLPVKIPARCNRCMNCKDCRFEVNQLSKIEQNELQVIRRNMKLDPIENVWITEYPYKTDPAILQDNRQQALALLIKLENRLKKNEVASDTYCLQFRDFNERGVLTEISKEEMDNYDGPVFYISHHEVFKEESASTPVRIVSNASLKFKGVSLNDILMKGPNTLSDLFSVKLNFRTYIIALVGDISKMYHSIKTTHKERHLRRILWRDMKVNEDPKTYGTNTVAFGDRPAAAISTVAIKETAELFDYVDPKAAQKIKNDMYVDDLATGDSTAEKVEKLKKNIRLILSKGGFRIKGFIISGDTSKESLSLLGSGEMGRVLGICWDPTSDEFSIKVRVNLSKKFKGGRKSQDFQLNEIPLLTHEKLTKRILLSIVNACYDLFGFIVPITIQLKIELRELYRKDLNLNWDDDIPMDMKLRWINILQLAKEAETLRFRRCISQTESVGDPELIIFNDGAPSAICAVAYIRWELNSGESVTQLVAARARVTPLERMTIPRIEMQSAVLGVRLAKAIVNGCGLNFQNVTHISDSQCTLATIKKDSTALKEFMGNRVAEITESTDVSQWFYVKSSSNIADLGTRSGATIEDINSDSEWQQGPSWLKLQRSDWPVSQEVSLDHVPAEEMTKNKICSSAIKKIPVVDSERVMSKSYSFLMRVTARIFIVFEEKSFLNNEVTPLSLEKAEKYWLKVSMVRTSEKMKKGHLRSLRPKVDENGIIVLSSRALKGMKMNYNQDTFPILTSDDPLAFLWMKEVHEEDHTGKTKTVAKSRRKFWILRAPKLAAKVKNSCYDCRLLDKKLAMQQMAPLPESRLVIAPVFHTTSIDLFGPFLIKDTVKKRVKMKIWGFIATCAATRAIYLDITENYSTDSILQVLRKFVTMRGCPGKIISDQGTQLKAASKDVAELMKDWDWDSVKRWASHNKIAWHFVPAEGQHQNGLSESLIKSVKRSIKHVVGENILTFSELQLAIYEIANIINTRPIGVLSTSDPEEPQPLTPNDLLLGRSTNEVPQGPFNTKVSATKRFLFVQGIVDDWWKKWYDTVLPSLVPSYKWQQRHRNVKVGDVCLIRYKGIRATYRLGRVTEVKEGEDGLVRTVRLKYKLPSEKVFRHVDRAVHGIAVIVPFEEQ